MDIKEVMKLPYGSKVKIVGRENIVWEVCNTSIFWGNRSITSWSTLDEIVNFEFTECFDGRLLSIQDVLCEEMVDHIVQKVVNGERRCKYKVVYQDEAYDLMGYEHDEGDYIGDLEYLSDILKFEFIDLGRI